MPRAISCAEFKARLDQAIDLMDQELDEIASHELDGAPAQFTFEDWWTHLANLIVPDIIMADADLPSRARSPGRAEPQAQRRG